MRGNLWWPRLLSGWVGCLAAAGFASGLPVAKSVGIKSCRLGAIEGQVRAGESFARPIGSGLEVRLEALSWGSGWVIRVLPMQGPRPAHDYAELSTPPYASVNPLLLSTDYSFRAQDAVAWNPRRFRFAASAAEYGRLADAYARYSKTSHPSTEVETELAALVSKSSEGTLQILDARLIPGTSNQAQTAAGVAAHFNTTAHTMEETAGGKGSPLGNLVWLRFKIGLEFTSGFKVDPSVAITRHKCAQ